MEDNIAAPFVLEDRKEAGRLLAERLSRLKLKNPLILALPRGGVVVGCEVAVRLKAELDIITPRKLHDPSDEELAIGAIMSDGSVFLNDYVINMRSVPESYIEKEKKAQMEESLRRLNVYRGERPYPKIKGRTVVIVDDGIATGATMAVATMWVKKQGAARIIIAVPVVPQETLDTMRGLADEIVYLDVPPFFFGIGQFYRDFRQTTDGEVVEMLKAYWQKAHSVV